MIAPDPGSARNMNCPKCGTENRDSARFCGECGASLSATIGCTACGTGNPVGQRFCNGCGRGLVAEATVAPDPSSYTAPHIADKIASSAAALEGERKQVTVMFCDVQSSMELAESVDSETWRAVMDRFYSLVGECVNRFEGTVNKFTGDGAMVLFGAPIAHEDHARRACYAALYLHDELEGYARSVRRDYGLGFSVRIGLNSGEVVVGGIGQDLNMDYTAIGNTVGLAARMEALSEPDKPYLTKSTAELVDGYFTLEDVGELQVKGLQAPVHAYALVGVGSARTRLDVSAGRGLSRFVGRAAELEALEAAYDRSRSGGQVVGVVADPGIGKSRLCREFTDSCRARNITVTEGRGVAHGRRIPLLPVIEMLRGFFGIGEDDEGHLAREKIAGRLLLMDEAFRDALPVLFDFLGVGDSEHAAPQIGPEGRERALFGAISRLVHARADQGGGVVVVEDLHWLDPGSEAFLANLIESLPGTRTLVIVNFRPEYGADWMKKSYYQRLPLLPLSGEAIAAMVRDLIGDDPSLDGVGDLIADRTGGNPFFIEEVVRSLVDAGTLVGRRGAYRLAASIDRIEIPPTVQAVLAARIDLLGERDKSVLEAAAVIGREFSEPVLQRVTGLESHRLLESLGGLCAAELVFERTLYPVPQYVFKHPLTEEVAYRTQLGERRARSHAAVAVALEELGADRLDEIAGILSNHWEQAREPVKAANWGARAATWAGQSHPADALRHWRRVRTLLKDSHDDPEAAGLALGTCLWILQFGWRQGLSDDEVEAVWREGLALAERSGNDWAKAALYGSHAVSRGMVGAVGEALEHALEAGRVARELNALELEMSVGSPYWMDLLGDTEAAIELTTKRIERMDEDYNLGRRVIGFSTLIFSTFFLAYLLTENGRIDQARPLTDRALRLAREHDDIESLGWTHNHYALLDYHGGEVRDGLAHARAGVEIAERTGSAFSRMTAYLLLGFAHLARGEWREAIEVEEEALQIMRDTRTGMQYEPRSLAAVAEARLGLDDADGAREAAERGADVAARYGMRTHEGHCRTMLGRARSRSHPIEARNEFARALELIGADYVAIAPRIHEGLADLAEMHGREQECERQLREALRLYGRIGAHGHARRLRERLAGRAGTAVE
jgi:class 3 adenylate cyclase/tetratricopeptide (TPR) repeat protein